MRKRIVSFTAKKKYGNRFIYQTFSENDYYDRKSFLKDRREIKKAGVVVKDKWSSKKFIPYNQR